MSEKSTAPSKKFSWKKWLKYSYLAALHILAGVAAFLILTALAVKFKWTNDAGDVDINNRYYEDIASQYGNESKKDSATLARDEYLMFQRLGVLSRTIRTSTLLYACWMLSISYCETTRNSFAP
jgi:hypothetical protein